LLEKPKKLAGQVGPVSSVNCQGQQLLFTKSGHLCIWGVMDDQLLSGLCMALIYGTFLLNARVSKEKNEANDVILDWCMNSQDHMAVFDCSMDFGPDKFPKDVTKAFQVLGLPRQARRCQCAHRVPQGRWAIRVSPCTVWSSGQIVIQNTI
jgi:hypothetical protein